MTPAARIVREVHAPGSVPLWMHPQWARRFPWLVQGTTARGDAEPFDFGLFGAVPVGTAFFRWRLLRESMGFPRAIHARQVHGAEIVGHDAGPAGLLVADSVDGHATATPGVLLTVSVADCVPISIVDPDRRAITLLHGGWRGIAGGIVEGGIAWLERAFGSLPTSLLVHFGPAICGACYEVGPEVHEALGLPVPAENRPVDIRATAARRAVAAGVPESGISVSGHCTRCGDSPFFSHRGGHRERQLGILGIRGGSTAEPR